MIGLGLIKLFVNYEKFNLQSREMVFYRSGTGLWPEFKNED